ncbi:MAG: sugar ABC transporter permease [Candidatus Micrarchaeaceae archaeon]
MKTYKGYLMLLIAFGIMGVLVFVPLIIGINLSFTNRNLLYPTTQYIGFNNYVNLLHDSEFWIAFLHSGILVSVVVTLEYIFGILLALTLKQNVPGSHFFRSIVMVTWVIPIVATVIMWQFMSQPGYGFINMILSSIGLKNYATYFFGSMTFAFPMIMILNLWRNVPFFGIAFLAAMQAIPDELYEAASIDGASKWQNFRYITLPGIKYTAMIMITIHVIWTFNQFSIVYIATGGGPINVTDVLPTYLYRQVWSNYNIGYGASIGVLMLLILLAFFFIFNRTYGREAT